MTSPPATVSITEIVFPQHANHYGTLFAGHALMLMAKAAFLAGRAVAQSDVVMASVADAQFATPVPWAACCSWTPGSAASAAAP